jgi:hypothetical protein
MTEFFTSIEHNALSVWVRESPSLLAFPFILYLHTLGLAMLAGINVGIDVWLLAARTVPPIRMIGTYRVMWLGFGINALSGFVLLWAYPAKALTNWVFFTKLLMIGIAMWVLEQLKGEMQAATVGGGREVGARVRRLATASLILWAGTILAGRFLAYTHSILLASEGY